MSSARSTAASCLTATEPQEAQEPPTGWGGSEDKEVSRETSPAKSATCSFPFHTLGACELPASLRVPSAYTPRRQLLVRYPSRFARPTSRDKTNFRLPSGGAQEAILEMSMLSTNGINCKSNGYHCPMNGICEGRPGALHTARGVCAHRHAATDPPAGIVASVSRCERTAIWLIRTPDTILHRTTPLHLHRARTDPSRLVRRASPLPDRPASRPRPAPGRASRLRPPSGSSSPLSCAVVPCRSLLR